MRHCISVTPMSTHSNMTQTSNRIAKATCVSISGNSVTKNLLMGIQLQTSLFAAISTGLSDSRWSPRSLCDRKLVWTPNKGCAEGPLCGGMVPHIGVGSENDTDIGNICLGVGWEIHTEQSGVSDYLQAPGLNFVPGAWWNWLGRKRKWPNCKLIGLKGKIKFLEVNRKTLVEGLPNH